MVAFLVFASLAVSCVGSAVSWGAAAYFTVKTLQCFQPARQWGRYLPPTLFLSSFLTPEGNRYRLRLLMSMAFFLFFIAASISIGLGIPVVL